MKKDGCISLSVGDCEPPVYEAVTELTDVIPAKVLPAAVGRHCSHYASTAEPSSLLLCRLSSQILGQVLV